MTAPNFLYMFEFVVDDLLITRPNHCAPEEYPTCCEITFKSSVFVSICDREFGGCIDTCAPKCGKCCLFSLEKPVVDTDELLIHIYKKKTEKCKFLVGAANFAIKPLFDKVDKLFEAQNPKWKENFEKHNKCLPDIRNPTVVVDNDCDVDDDGRREQLCPAAELTKRLLPLFNMKGTQTGNLVLIMRLVCNGPAIVSSFPFAKVCTLPCGGTKKQKCFPPPSSTAGNCKDPNSEGGSCCGRSSATTPGVTSCSMPDPCKKDEEKKQICRRYFGCNADKGCPCDECEDDVDRGCALGCAKKNKTHGTCPSCQPSPCCPSPPKCCPQECKKKPTKSNKCKRDTKYKCERSFSNEIGNGGGCSCDECMEECEAGLPKKQIQSKPSYCPSECKKNPKCSEAERGCSCDECNDDNNNDDDDDADCSDMRCYEEEESAECFQTCFICPKEPDPGPDAYDEFEACLNGTGLTIRVLKDTHQVENIYDGTENGIDDSGCECDKCPGKENHSNCESLCELLKNSVFARNHIKRRTAGHILNNPKLPKIKANIKYSGNDACCAGAEGNYDINFSKFKKQCEAQENKVDLYRKRNVWNEDCGPIVPPKHPQDTCNCCMQVEPQDIKNALKGINVDTRKKGIEVCYKTCDDTNSDVFVVKLGNKQKCQKKRNAIEIELKTPKEPLVLPVQMVTTETQINEQELDDALADLCKKKKGKKGKGKGKGKKK